MNQNPNMTGLASLLASQGRGEDKVLVHMTPGEVQGLQALALAHGGSLERNPQTGLPEAGFLKSILPAIAGFTLNRVFPGLGSTATSAIVGGATGLIEGSFKKGLNAGFSAYSGSNISEGLRRAAAVRMAPPKTLAQQFGLKEEELLDYGDLTKPSSSVDLGVKTIEPTVPLPAVSPVMPRPSRSGIFEGIKGLGTEEGRKAFASGMEGGYTSPFGKKASQYVSSLGLQTMLTPQMDDDEMKGSMSKPRYYIPGEYNPRYGQGYGEWLFKPGTYSDKYPGYADGGMVLAGEERFADGGEIMVSPGAVLPQQITVSPQFTQDRAGLGKYYESLLVPPDNTPRDTTALKNYLDALRARLKKPYQPFGPGTDTGGGGGGGGGGGSGGTVTPPGNDPFATGVTGTPIDFIQPPAPPAPTKPKEELTPPSSVAPGATPSDLGNLFTVPTTINVPVGAISVLPLDELIVPDVTEEEMISPDALGDLFRKPPPIATVGAGGLEPIVSEPDEEEDTSSVKVETVDDAGNPLTIPVSTGGRGADYAGTGSPAPGKTGYVSTRENPYGYDFVELGFINPQTTQEVADASQPIVDEILKNFEEQQKAEKEGKIEKAKEFGADALELLAKLSPEVAIAMGLYEKLFKDKEDEKKEEREATVKVEELPTVDTEAPPPTNVKAPSGGGSAIPFISNQNYMPNYTIRNLINPTESEEGFEPDREYLVTLPDIVEEVTSDIGKRAGGPIRAFSAGGLGSLQQYAVGGKLVNGQGDGMSDDIKANISGVQEARLADGEFVIPADVVSHLGNGSTDAGAKQLYAMMDRIRKARTGRTRQAPEVEAAKYMPA